MLKLRSHSVDETREIASAIARLAGIDDVILLIGEMGAGKTAFAQGFGKGLGVDDPITSPTFNLVHTYDAGRIVLHHADLYRLNTSTQVADLALGELVEGDGVLLVEWGQAVADLLGEHLEIRIESPSGVGTNSDSLDSDTEQQRDVTVTPCGRSWLRRWSRIETALRPWTVVDEMS